MPPKNTCDAAALHQKTAPALPRCSKHAMAGRGTERGTPAFASCPAACSSMRPAARRDQATRARLADACENAQDAQGSFFGDIRACLAVHFTSCSLTDVGALHDPIHLLIPRVQSQCLHQVCRGIAKALQGFQDGCAPHQRHQPACASWHACQGRSAAPQRRLQGAHVLVPARALQVQSPRRVRYAGWLIRSHTQVMQTALWVTSIADVLSGQQSCEALS